jgi:ribonuclease HI
VSRPATRRAFGVHDLEEFRARMLELRSLLSAPTDPGRYVAYTDGACLGNPEGPGGWAAATFAPGGTQSWKLFGHLSSTSNNRAEALGVLGALEWVPAGSQIEVHADSELTVRILQARYKVRANTDIWDVIRGTIEAKQLQLSVEWVRGHAGDPLNELADRLSKVGALNGRLDDVDESVDLAALVPAEPDELAGLAPRTDWEREFVSSVADQLRRGRALSPKQQAVIERMRSRPRS